jgi:RNA polymerase sigma-70 factor (ECF subfamily)
MEDRELAALLRDDPERGMAALTERYAGLLYSVVRGRIGENLIGSADIGDIVADVLSAFYLHLDGYRPERCSLKSYLCVMARNRAVDYLRKSRIVPIPLEEAEDSFDIAEATEERELRTRLLDAIKGMGEPDSDILIRKYCLGQRSKEIGAALGLSAANVDTRAHRAIAKLREIFKGEWL